MLASECDFFGSFKFQSSLVQSGDFSMMKTYPVDTAVEVLHQIHSEIHTVRSRIMEFIFAACDLI